MPALAAPGKVAKLEFPGGPSYPGATVAVAITVLSVGDNFVDGTAVLAGVHSLCVVSYLQGFGRVSSLHVCARPYRRQHMRIFKRPLSSSPPSIAPASVRQAAKTSKYKWALVQPSPAPSRFVTW